MKAAIEKKITHYSYPNLYVNAKKDIIVLKASPSSGMVVYSRNPYYAIGSYSGIWTEGGFEPFEDEVILYNS